MSSQTGEKQNSAEKAEGFANTYGLSEESRARSNAEEHTAVERNIVSQYEWFEGVETLGRQPVNYDAIICRMREDIDELKGELEKLKRQLDAHRVVVRIGMALLILVLGGYLAFASEMTFFAMQMFAK